MFEGEKVSLMFILVLWFDEYGWRWILAYIIDVMPFMAIYATYVK